MFGSHLNSEWYAFPLVAHPISPGSNTWTDMFLAVVVSATEVGNTRPTSPTPETVAQIHDVGFYCLTSSLWDDLSLSGDPLASPGYGDSSDLYTREHGSGTATPAPEHPCQPLRKIISAGTFYYATEPQWDISSRLQRRLSRNEPWDAASYDDRFVWNEYIVRSLLDFRERLDAHERAELDQCQFIVRCPHVCWSWRDADIFCRSLSSKAMSESVRSHCLPHRLTVLQSSRRYP